MTPKEINARDAKLIQYLNEAFGKEKQLETALEAHIAMTTRDSYKKRLQQHLRETKAHARDVERRIKKLGGTPETVSVPGPEALGGAASRVQEVAQRGVALAQGPLHAVRGTGEEEKQLKNAKDEYSDEAQEIATYTAIEALAESVGDRETARLARSIRRQEERMASFLERLIPQLTKAVVQAEIPPAERNGGRRRTSTRRSTTARRASGTPARKRTARAGARSARTRTSRSGTRTRSTRSTARKARSTARQARSGARTTRSRAGTARSSARTKR